MARLVRKANGAALIQYELGKVKQTVWLGRVDKKTAGTWLYHVGKLVEAKAYNVAARQETVDWTIELDDARYGRLSDRGLVPPRRLPEPVEVMTLGAMFDRYIERRTDLKASTKAALDQAKRVSVEFFGEDRDVRTVNTATAKDWRRHIAGKHSEGYVAKLIAKAKTVWADALERGLIDVNPMKGIKNGAEVNRAKARFVLAADVEKVIAVAPDPEWKALIALARYAGLRVPSEPLALRWSDIDFETGKMIITSVKTEQHDGKGVRVVPIFPELRPHLLALFEQQAAAGEVYVITRYRGTKQNLRTQFERYIRAAGLAAWPRLWQNLRASRATELVDRFPSHVVSAWLGHSEQIADRHYRQVTDDHFAKAIEVAAGVANGGGMERNDAEPVQPDQQDSPEKRKKPRKSGLSSGRYRARTCDLQRVMLAL